MMGRGFSIHIGVNRVDASAYPKVPPTLRAAERDAVAMEALATAEGFTTTPLRGPEATRGAVMQALERAAAELNAGDLLVLTFSGHGGRFLDLVEQDSKARPVGADNRRPRDEADGYDEAWCLTDGVLIDDDLYDLLAKFRAGVRIVALSDSCYSGTVLRDAKLPVVQASVLLIAACADDRVTRETELHGKFTSAALGVWNGGAFKGSHLAFHAAIVRSGNPTASVFRVGAFDLNFEDQRPFTI